MKPTRRGFLALGATSVATAATAGVAGRAAAQTESFNFTITEGEHEMFDGTPVWFRAFARTGAPFTVPGPPLGNPGPGIVEREIFEGDTVRMRIRNDTPRTHTFLIDRASTEQPSSNPVVFEEIPARATREFSFTAPDAGTYIYRDADRNNRILGMHGVVVVMPRGVGGRNLPYAPAPGRLVIPAEVGRQYVWMLHSIDPVLGEMARTRFNEHTISFPMSKMLPRYFVINGQTGDHAVHDDVSTVPVVPLQDAAAPVVGVMIRCVNTGVATHQLHWHGNHVFVVQRGSEPQSDGIVFERDVLRVEPLQRTAVILPAHTGYDAFPPINENHPKGDAQQFPMHCHAEMSQTGGGGGYPFGMLTDWFLAAPRDGAVAAVEKRIAERRERHRRNEGMRRVTRVPNGVSDSAITRETEPSSSGPSGSSGSSGKTRSRKRGSGNDDDR
jgi:FtsP/CotA-like multicopper oxidase with cupredoxin domain